MSEFSSCLSRNFIPEGVKKIYLNAVVKKGQVMKSDAKQNRLPLAFGMHERPKDAPAKILRQIESDAQAVAVSIKAGGHKLAYIAAAIGKSESYVCLIRAGKRPMPDRLVGPFCAATGTNLLRQYRDLQAALAEACERREVDRLAEMLRAAA